MNKTLKFYAFFLATSLVATAVVYGTLSSPKEQKKEATEQQAADIAKISEAFGHLIGKNLENLDVNFDIEKIVKGLKDAAEGKEPPMTEAECVEAISSIQESNFKELAIENLKKADEFMAKNAEEKEVVILEKGKLHYKIEKEGHGSTVEEHCSPLIRYVGKYVDGTVFGASKEEEVISLDETIQGIAKGVIGMKEGEKRILYIHPDFGYGSHGYLAPNSLLSFEIEVVKAQSTQKEEMDSLSASHAKERKEIASPAHQADVIR
jgi:peptidylprolyl isomerase